MRSLAVLACLALGAATARGEVDPEFVGVWLVKTGTHAITWDVSASGSYVARVEGEGQPAGEYGTLEAKAGRWSIRARNFRMDDGAYTFEGPDKVTVTGRAGGFTWERIGKASVFEPPPAVAGDMGRLTVGDLLAAARAHAKFWQPDAVLVGAHGMAGRDGTCNANSAPTINLTFHSPGSNQGLILTPVAQRDFVWLVAPQPLQGLTLPLAEEFLDLPQAFEKAAGQGFKLGDLNPFSLRAWASVVGESDRTAWQIGHQPMLNQAFFLDAVTGAKVTYLELSGNAERLRRLEEWSKGRAHSAGADFAAWRKEAQTWADKLAPGQTPYEVWVSGSFQGGTLTITRAVFRFFGEGKGARGQELHSLSIAIDARTLNGRRGAVLRTRPAALPDDLVSPGKAATVLWGLNPQVPANCTYLQLLHLAAEEEAPRSWPAEFGYARSNIGGIFLHRGPVPKGERWLWRMIARRPGAETGVGLGGNYRSHIGAVHCDARSAEPLDPPAPDFGQTKFR